MDHAFFEAEMEASMCTFINSPTSHLATPDGRNIRENRSIVTAYNSNWCDGFHINITGSISQLLFLSTQQDQ
jgi:hypothetical protein